jgi:CRP/FNR family transcriptional regulator, cyclic AMP receptor protein
MNETDIIQLLKSSSLFANMHKSILWRIASLTEEKLFSANEFFFHEGEKADYCYIIQSGSVKIFHEKKQGIIATAQAGDIIGELSIIDGLPRSASVQSIEPTATLVISEWDFKAQMQAYPEIALQLLPILAARLRHTQQLLADCQHEQA